MPFVSLILSAVGNSPYARSSDGGVTWDTSLAFAPAAFSISAAVVALLPTSNTPSGTNVSVQPVDAATGQSPVTVTFSTVTQAGNTTLTFSGTGAPPPSAFKLGNPPTYYELSSTAVFSGPVTVCINYTGISFGKVSKFILKMVLGSIQRFR